MGSHHVGLTRTELNREIRWRLRQAPSDPERMLPFIADLIVSTIDANNAALAAQLEQPGGDDLTREY